VEAGSRSVTVAVDRGALTGMTRFLTYRGEHSQATMSTTHKTLFGLSIELRTRALRSSDYHSVKPRRPAVRIN
jgi:hypothetical protein